VFAHGYIPNLPGVELDFYDDLPGVGNLGTLAQTLGFAYATTSYRRNGLVILDGIQDVRDLMAHYEASGLPKPFRSYLAGASEGALVATLTVERSPTLFTGAYATCGPIGSFREEINYLADFRVLFDYFFPGVFEGDVTFASPKEMAAWGEGPLQMAVADLLRRNPATALELLRTARAPFDPARPETIIETTLQALRYTVLGANDLRAALGGNPYDNRFRLYFGSSNDLRLNLGVKRYAADAQALRALRPYETSGALSVPVVGLHTTGDPVVPFLQPIFYFVKARPVGRYIPIPVARYGHCAFTLNEVLAGLALLSVQP
jgi:pimeloyl-ACP methyl ester carboxylesterase